MRVQATLGTFIVAGLFGTSCADHSPTGLGNAPRHAALSIQPRFSRTAVGGPVVTLSRIRGVLHSIEGDSLVSESRFERDTATLAFDVQFTGASADFELDITAFDENGVIVYRAHQTIHVRPGSNGNVAAPTLVYAAPDSGVKILHVSPDALQLDADSAGAVAVNGTGADGRSISPIRVGWTSRDPSVASVDDVGGVHAGSFQGTTWIVARTATNVADSVRVLVRAPVAKITITPSALQIVRGQSAAVTAELRDAGDHLITDRVATWSSSNPAVVGLSPTGGVTGLNIGSATLTANAEGKSATVTATVVSPVDHIELSATSLTFASIGETKALTARVVARTGTSTAGSTVTWRSTNPSVVAVDANGGVAAHANGTASIVASVDGVDASAGATVHQLAVRVDVSPKTLSATALGQIQSAAATALDALGNPLPATEVSWTSSDPTVASVSQAGEATSRAPGTTSIVATVGDKHDAAQLTVIQIPSLLFLSSDRGVVTAGQTAQLSARVADASGYVIQGVTAAFSSGAPSIASVASGGRVLGVAEGSAQINGTFGSLTGAILIRVIAVGGGAGAGGGGGGGGTVTGRILDAATSAGVAGAVVTGPTGSTTTAADGSFTLANVPDGSTLSVSAPGYASTQYLSVSAGGGTLSLGSVSLAPASGENGTISGRIVGQGESRDIPDAVVTIRSGAGATSGPALQQLAADPTGFYSASLPAGTYTFTASASGFAAHSMTITILGGASRSNVNLPLTPLHP